VGCEIEATKPVKSSQSVSRSVDRAGHRS
jgi:hypothetical protein